MDRLGKTIGSYYLDTIIGRGGMGTVYGGKHIYIEKRVAVKVLHEQFAACQDAVSRFLREARAASSIQHPNIVDVTDFGTGPDGGIFFVMEHLDGKSLEEVIEDHGHLELHRALNIANQIALALAAAHDKNVIHRDLKPENILLIHRPGRRDLVRTVPSTSLKNANVPAQYIVEKEETYDFVKLLDFGIAKMLSTDKKSNSIQGAIFGTPEYMAPEACRGEEVDHRTDIYSLGVILFDMLTGRPPFEAIEATDVLRMHIFDPPPSPIQEAPDNEITPATEATILKAMSKNPADRHQSMDEFRADLKRCFGSVTYGQKSQRSPRPPTSPRTRRLTDEINEWLQTDPSSLTPEEANRFLKKPPPH